MKSSSVKQIWKTMSKKELRRLATAVFFLFGTLGPLSMLMDQRLFPGSWIKLIVLTLACGLFSASIIFLTGKPFRLAISIIIFIAFMMSSGFFEKQLFNTPAKNIVAGEPVTFTQSELNSVSVQRTLFGIVAIIMLSTGYGLFIGVVAKENKRRAEVETEIKIAQGIQRSLLPASVMKFGWCEVAGATATATDVGGDFYDVVPLPGDQVLLVVADASGHGTGAGILSAMTKSAILEEIQHCISPAQILGHLNTMICQVAEKNMFVTCALVRLSKNERQAIIATAGHPPVLHFVFSEQSCEKIRSANLALGLREGAEFTETSVEFDPRDNFFLFTDGIIESVNARDEQFDLDALISFVKERSMTPPEQLTEEVVSQVKKFSGAAELHDDATILAAHIG